MIGRTLLWMVFVSAVLWVSTAAPAFDRAHYRLVDLTHPFNAETVYWPTAPSGFQLKRLAYGKTERGYFYAANTFAAPEHGGTHLDAPIHFAAGKHTVEAIPLEQLVGPSVVIDVTEQAAADRDYRLTRTDVLSFEQRHGPIAPGSIVLLRTGWSRFWPDRKRYLGDDTPGDAAHLHFPSFGIEAVEWLIGERGITAIGVDVASIDYGPSQDFVVHQRVAAANIVALENLTNLHELPATGTTLIALPMLIEGGSGAPARVIALVPSDH